MILFEHGDTESGNMVVPVKDLRYSQEKSLPPWFLSVQAIPAAIIAVTLLVPVGRKI